MTPQPPEGYATWLDYVLDPGDPYKSFAGEWAAAELAALRAERDAWKALSTRTQAALAELVLAVRLHPADVGHDAALRSAIATLRPEDKP